MIAFFLVMRTFRIYSQQFSYIMYSSVNLSLCTLHAKYLFILCNWEFVPFEEHHSFFRLNNFLLYVYTTFYFFIHLLREAMYFLHSKLLFIFQISALMSSLTSSCLGCKCVAYYYFYGTDW